MAERLRLYHLKWLEDCLMPDDVQGFDEPRRRVPMYALVTGELSDTPLPGVSAVLD